MMRSVEHYYYGGMQMGWWFLLIVVALVAAVVVGWSRKKKVENIFYKSSSKRCNKLSGNAPVQYRLKLRIPLLTVNSSIYCFDNRVENKIIKGHLKNKL